MKVILLAGALSLTAVSALAAPVTYKVDPAHTYPSFEADHMGGVSKWRGKFNSSSGSFTLDKEAKAGTVDITIDVASLDFGNEKLNEHALKEPAMFDVAKFPTATYKGKVSKWGANGPQEISGDLTLHGVTKPVTLKVNSFTCKQNPMSKKEVCGADAETTFNRGDFGVNYALQMGFKPEVTLRISVEGSPAA
jgi:polyisoprenoid-binding protein YceI